MSLASAPTRARKPRSRGENFFVPVTKDCAKELAAEGCTFAEIGYFMMVLTDKSTTPVGTLYQRHEWAEIDGTNVEHMEKCFRGLEKRGKIVWDGYQVLVRSWIRTHGFKNPKYLRAALYPLQNGVDSPLIRFVIGTEMLRLNVADREPANAKNIYESANLVWQEIVGRSLPPAHHMTGRLDAPNEQMLDDLVRMPGIEEIVAGLDERKWSVVKDELRPHLSRARAAVDGTVTRLPRAISI